MIIEYQEAGRVKNNQQSVRRDSKFEDEVVRASTNDEQDQSRSPWDYYLYFDDPFEHTYDATFPSAKETAGNCEEKKKHTGKGTVQHTYSARHHGVSQRQETQGKACVRRDSDELT